LTELRQAALSREPFPDGIERDCMDYVAEPYAQRYHFRHIYARKHKTTAWTG
jgi:hypothetical protein